MTRQWIAAFGAYVVLVASRWVLKGWLVSMLPESEVEVLVLGLVAVGVGVSGRNWSSVHQSHGLQTVGSGLMLLGVPSVLWALPGGGLPVLTRVSLLALVPVVLVVVSSARGSGGTPFPSLLGASLAGMAGCLLLLTVDLEALIQKPVAAITVIVAVVSIAVGSYLGHGGVGGMRFRPAVVLMAGPSAVLILSASGLRHVSMVMPGWGDALGVSWGGAELLLLVFLVRGLSPVVFGARFLLVPLLTAVEGFVLVRPPITWRLLVGAGLLSFGAVWLLRGGGGRERDSSLSLL